MSSNNYLVFDWGGTFLKYAIMDETTAILEKSKVPSPAIDDSVEDLYERIDPIIRQYQSEVKGIAVSMPGMLDDKTGYARTSGALKFLAGSNVAKEMRERYGLPVSIENDGKAAALAEHWKGSLKGCSNCAVVIIGTGIGGGIILNNQLLVGKDFSAGEYSYMAVDERKTDTTDGYWCRYGHVGLSRMVASRTGEDYQPLDGIEIFRRIRNHDEQAIAALKEFTYGYAVQIYNLSVLLDLEKIAIGGGLSEDPLLMDYLNAGIRSFRERLPFGSENEHLPIAELVVCKYRNDANLIGALYHHLYGSWEK
ncbi:MAG: ROK family protein [Solobacterium sp.]|nr:ROK family protein [Solobacterium sp.]